VEPGTFLGRTNVLAVEVHQEDAIPGGEMFFDLELLGGVPRPSELLTEADVQAARRVLVHE
jgi:hypothetical protein